MTLPGGKASHMQGGASGNILGLGDNWQEEATGKQGLSGGASQQTAGGYKQSHPTQEQANPSKPGLGQRFKTWAKERAAPALGRGLRHLGAATAGAVAGGPLGALAGLGGSMYQAHKGKQSGQYDKVMGGEG